MSTKEGELHFAPEFVPVPYISPSRLHSLKECPLREAWASAKAPELLPRSPNASLGTAIHRLLESAGKGELSPNQLAIRWTSLLGDVERDMAADWRARHLVPLERSVRDFEVRRLQAFAGARELMRMSKAALPATGPGRRGQGFEIEVESRDGTVRGRIDEVRSTPDGVVLRDYKSGSIYEKDAPQSREIKESYVMQLMLYAAVYSECYGRWPDFVELVPVNGNAVRLLVDRNACVALLEDGVATLEEVNVTIRDLAPNGQALETRLARPSPGACAFCP